MTDEMTLLDRILSVATTAANDAATFIRTQAGKVEAWEKAPSNLVTEIDEAAQGRIIQILTGALPEYGVMAEEGDASAERPDTGWIVDPIDGTTNFTRGLYPYAVSIAFQREGLVQVGVVHEVSRNDVYIAVRGQGAFWNGTRMQVSQRPRLSDSIVTTGFPVKEPEQVGRYVEVLHRFIVECQGVRRFGAASVDLAHVACGLTDGFFESGINPWDVAAGLLLVEEAGGRVTDLRGTRDALYAGEIAASNGWIHEEMLLLTTPLLYE